MFCKKCGAKMEDSRKFCQSCGAKIETSSIHQKKVKWPVIAIVAGVILLLGIIIGGSDPVDKALDKMEKAIVKIEKLQEKISNGSVDEGELMVEYTNILKDFNEADKLLEGYDDSDLTSEQWQRLIELTKRANEILY